MNLTKELLTKLNGAMEDLQYLQKDKSVGSQYKVLSFDGLKSELLPVLRKHGLYLHCTLNKHERIQSDGKTSRTDVETTVSIYDAENPEAFVNTISIGSGVDNECKDPGKAQSYSFKAGVYHLFQLESGDDEESRFEVNKKQLEAKEKAAKESAKKQAAQIKKMLASFEKLEVTTKMIEAYLGCKADKINAAQFNELRMAYGLLAKAKIEVGDFLDGSWKDKK